MSSVPPVKLHALFDAKVGPKEFANIEDISGLIGYYAHGNGPSYHIACLYDHTVAPWATRHHLAEIMHLRRVPTSTGLVGTTISARCQPDTSSPRSCPVRRCPPASSL